MKILKESIKYVIALGVAGLLLWLVFRQIDVKQMLTRLKDINYFFVGLSMLLMIVAHLVRGYRWSLMLAPVGYKISIFRTFNAILVGYVANLFLPRMGEITRCGILKRTDDVQFSTSFGTVIAERIIDVFTLLSLIMLNFLLEYDLLKTFFTDLFKSKFTLITQNLFAIYIIAGVGFVVLIILFLLLRAYKEKLKNIPLYLKIRNLLKELVHGIMSIRKIENKLGFWLSTILMWVLYFLLSFVIIFSMKETAGLPIVAGFTILVTGSIGMATPVQGGIGAVHVLISSVLVLYGIVLEDGLLFATVLHSSQMIGTIFFGGISLIVTVLLQRKRTRGEVPASNT